MRTPQQSNTWVVRYWLWIAVFGFLIILIPFLLLAMGPTLLLILVCAAIAYKFNI